MKIWRKKPILLFALFLGLCLTPTPARSNVMSSPTAECPDYLNAAADLVQQFTPTFNAITQPHLFKSETPGWDPGSYHTRLGIKISSHCFKGTSSEERAQEAAKFEEMLDHVLQGAHRCGRHRLMTSVLQLLYHAIDTQPTVDCMPTGCARSAEACVQFQSNTINIKNFGQNLPENKKQEDLRFSHYTVFHELLHLSRADNNATPKHNDYKESDLEDEVYYWENTCFDPAVILAKMRKSLNECAAQGRDADHCDFKQACRKPFETLDPSLKRFRYNAREIESSCLFYDHYLRQEVRLTIAIDTHLSPEILSCEASDLACPDFTALRERTPELAEFLPPKTIDAQAVKEWRLKTCASSEEAASISSDLSSCAGKISKTITPDKGQWPAPIPGLIASGKLKESEAQALRRYWSAASAKSLFILNGPQNAGALVQESYSDEPMTSTKRFEHLAASLRQCETVGNDAQKESERGLKGTEMCRKYGLFVRGLQAQMIREWLD